MTDADDRAGLRFLHPKEEGVRSALAQDAREGVGALPRMSRLEARVQPQEVGSANQGASGAQDDR